MESCEQWVANGSSERSPAQFFVMWVYPGVEEGAEPAQGVRGGSPSPRTSTTWTECDQASTERGRELSRDPLRGVLIRRPAEKGPLG